MVYGLCGSILRAPVYRLSRLSLFHDFHTTLLSRSCRNFASDSKDESKLTDPPSASKSRVLSPTKGMWNLPRITTDGLAEVPEILDYKEEGNRVGMLIDDRPNVPPNWRKNKSLQPWQRQMFALREKFYGQTWAPRKKLSRTAMEGIRKLRDLDPTLSTGDLAREFKVSPEAIRRILKSKWQPTNEQHNNINERWRRRGERLRSARQPVQPINIKPTRRPRQIKQQQQQQPKQTTRRRVNNIETDFF
jgi:hypothetical protein